MPQTVAEKVLSRQNLTGAPVNAGSFIDASVDKLLLIEYQHIRKSYASIGFRDGPPHVWDPERVILMNEHVQPPTDLLLARSNLASKSDAARLGLRHFYPSEMGVCHQIMLDDGHVRPGELVVGNDSHTIAYGGVNVVSTGIGIDEACYVMAFGRTHFVVPETVKVTLTGSARPYPFGKDVILSLAGEYGDAFAQDKALEFHGSFAADSDVAARLTIADHGVEVGAKFGVFLADDKTARYLRMDPADPGFTPISPDQGARYMRELVVDVDAIPFVVARPFRFDNVAPVNDVRNVRIDQARIGSCANGRFEDIEIAARILRGQHVAKHVKFYVSPASMAVYRQCAEAGLITTLLEAGVDVLPPGCAICQTPSIVLNEEVCITSTTRNYRGRFGGSTCSEAQIYLGGPATVAASAIAGEITDPTEFLDA